MTPDGLSAQTAPTDFASVFAAVAARHADDIAVADPDGRVTYREMDRWSDAIAAAVLDAVGPGEEPVLVLAGQDAAAVTAFLAVAKCARPVVMLDSTTPIARMRGIAEGAAPVAIVYARALRDQVDAIGSVAGVPVALPEKGQATPATFERVVPPLDAPLTLVFTSGSTGKPKGVIIGSTAFMSVVLAAGLKDGGDRVLCPVPLGFMTGFGMMVRTLASGGEFHLNDPRVYGVESLADRIDADQITEVASTPYVMRALAAALPSDRRFPSINLVMLGGEAVLTQDVRDVRRMTRDDCIITNQLGSTESWGVANLVVMPGSALPDQSFLPVGGPSAGRELTLIDEAGETVTEPGLPGVIHVVGQQMAAGYWRDPVSTAARFGTLADGRRTYNTGDIGRWDERGQLEYVGRADYMLKIRGYLVEPAEIESHIRATDEVDDVVVVGQPSPRGDGTTVVGAYVVPAPHGWISGAAIRRRLAAELPSYMVPAYVVELTALPRNPNGKVDRARLPEPPAPAPVPPVHKYEYEEAIADVAATALGLDAVGMNDDLFELGLDSLAVEEMVAVLDEQLNLQISSATIMANPTAARLARVPRGRAENLTDGILVTLAPGDGRPVFAFSGAGGLALQLRELAQLLGEDRPVHGIQARGLEGYGLPDLTVARMARRSLRTMRRLQPHGPYSLVGHSLGALIAYEVARRLISSGETVDFLGLLDPPDPILANSVTLRSDLMAKAGYGPAHATALSRARAVWSARYPLATPSFWRSTRDHRRFNAWFRVGGAAAARYRVRHPVAVENAYFYLVERTPSMAADTWFNPPATVVVAPGDHLSMLRRPFVNELAELASRHLSGHARGAADHPAAELPVTST